MKKVFLFSVIGFTLAFLSCRVTENPKKVLSGVESFSPGYVKTGDTVRVIGVNLEGSTITVGGKSVTIIKTDKSNVGIQELSFKITDDLTSTTKANNNNFITVKYPEDGEHKFSFPLVVNYEIESIDVASGLGGWLDGKTSQVAGEILEGPKQLLIADFDDAGIRRATPVNATSFDQTQFEAVLKDPANGGGIADISDIKTPGGGNHLWVNEDISLIGQNTNGFGADINTRSELTNNKEVFPNNFVDYPFSPIETASDLSDTYLNFLIYKGGSDGGILFPYLYNDDLGLADRYRYNGLIGRGASKGLNDWEWINIQLSDTQLRDGFGFGSKLSQESFEKFNKINLTFSHDLLKDQGEGAPAIDVSGANPVEIYIDHIILTQGAPFYGHVPAN